MGPAAAGARELAGDAGSSDPPPIGLRSLPSQEDTLLKAIFDMIHGKQIDMQKQSEEHLEVVMKRMEDRFGTTNRLLSDLQVSVTHLSDAKAQFDSWRPEVEAQVDGLCATVSELQKLFAQHGFTSSGSRDPSYTELVDPYSTPSVSAAASGPIGHHDDFHYRGPGLGHMLPLIRPRSQVRRTFRIPLL